MTSKRRSPIALVLAAGTGAAFAQQAGESGAGAGPVDEALGPLDAEVQALKSRAVELNRDLALLEEELFYPPSTRLVVFVSMDVGEFFDLDSVRLTLDGKDVTSYLYSDAEAEALHRGGVQRLYLGNVTTGEHELVAVFTGVGPHGRDYRRGAAHVFDKGTATKYVELTITDEASTLRPEFVVEEWE